MALGALWVLLIIIVVFSILLIVGIIKNDHKLMIPWIIVASLVFATDCLLVIFFLLGVEALGFPYKDVLLWGLFHTLRLCLEALIWYSIYSKWRDMRNKSESAPDHIVTYDAADIKNQTPDCKLLAENV
ncbi:uncharacterized protein ACRADG_011344 isoform 3-T4 [Cochliomyia hominivorax]